MTLQCLNLSLACLCFFNVAATFKIYICHHKENQEDTLFLARCHLFAGWGSQHWSPRTGARMWSEISWSMILTIVVKVIIMIIFPIIIIFPSHHLTGGRHGQNRLLVRLRRVVPCRQISHPGHPVIRVKKGQVYYFPSKVKHFLPTSPLPVDEDSPFLDPCSGFWHSNGQIATIVSELEL